MCGISYLSLLRSAISDSIETYTKGANTSAFTNRYVINSLYMQRTTQTEERKQLSTQNEYREFPCTNQQTDRQAQKG